MTLTKNKRPRHPEGDGGRGGGAGSLGSLHLGPGLPAEGAPGFTPPGRPPGVQSDSWSTDPSRAGAGQEGGSQRGQRGGGSSRPGPLAGHSWLCPGCLQQSQSVKKKKKKILIWSVSASSQARVREERQEQGSPTPSAAPRGARLSLCRRRGADTGLTLPPRAPPPGTAGRGGAGAGQRGRRGGQSPPFQFSTPLLLGHLHR